MDKNIKNLYGEIFKTIENSKKNLVTVVNSEMIVLYWNVGRIIKTEILKYDKAEYGKSIISTLSKELTQEYGRGYSQRNLFNMVKFYEVFFDK